jgi:hypothetical protein
MREKVQGLTEEWESKSGDEEAKYFGWDWDYNSQGLSNEQDGMSGV